MSAITAVIMAHLQRSYFCPLVLSLWSTHSAHCTYGHGAKYINICQERLVTHEALHGIT